MKQIFAFLLLFFISTLPVFAQSAVTLSVTPPVAYIKLKPGSETTHTVTLENTGTSPVTIQPKLVDFTSDGQTGTPILDSNTRFPYLALESQQFQAITLPPQKKAQLTLKIVVPGEAPTQEFPMTILFESQPAAQIGSESPVVGSVGSNLIVLVLGKNELPSGLRVKEIISPRFVDSFRALTFTPLLENTLPYTSMASGSGVIKNWQGKSVAEYKIYPDAVLGNSTRQARAAQEVTIEAENAPPTTTLEPTNFLYKPAFLLGPYTVEITLIDPLSPTPQTVSKQIIALPLIVLGLLVFGALVIGGYYWYRRRLSTRL